MSVMRNISNQIVLTMNILLIFVVPLFLITSDVRIAFNSLMLYEYGFDKYDVANQTGLNMEELKEIASDIKNYFNSDYEFLDIKITVDGGQIDLFNKKEISHMKDVKDILSRMNKIQEISGIYIVVCLLLATTRNKLRWPHAFVGSILRGCLVTLLLVLCAAVGIVLGFDSLFIKFHIMFFESGTWAFDPRTNYLTRLFTEGFFMESSLLIGISVFIQASMIYFGLWILKIRLMN